MHCDKFALKLMEFKVLYRKTCKQKHRINGCLRTSGGHPVQSLTQAGAPRAGCAAQHPHNI